MDQTGQTQRGVEKLDAGRASIASAIERGMQCCAAAVSGYLQMLTADGNTQVTTGALRGVRNLLRLVRRHSMQWPAKYREAYTHSRADYNWQGEIHKLGQALGVLLREEGTSQAASRHGDFGDDGWVGDRFREASELLEELLYTVPVVAEAALPPLYAQHMFQTTVVSLLSLARHWAGEPALQPAFRRSFRGLMEAVGGPAFLAMVIPALGELSRTTPPETMGEVLAVLDTEVAGIFVHGGPPVQA
jgi:hypothetical protein